MDRAREIDGKDRLQKIREELMRELAPEILESAGGDQREISRRLSKIQVHLVRVMTCEFLFHHVI